MSNTIRNPQTYKFFRKESGQYEDVQIEKYCWEAHYKNGQILKQFDDKGLFHQFKEIDQSILHVFKMINYETKQTYSLIFNSDTMQLIHFYRNFIFSAGTTEEIKMKAYAFGYTKKGKAGKVQKVINMIMPNNEVVLLEDPNALVIG